MKLAVNNTTINFPRQSIVMKKSSFLNWPLLAVDNFWFPDSASSAYITCPSVLHGRFDFNYTEADDTVHCTDPNVTRQMDVCSDTSSLAFPYPCAGKSIVYAGKIDQWFITKLTHTRLIYLLGCIGLKAVSTLFSHVTTVSSYVLLCLLTVTRLGLCQCLQLYVLRTTKHTLRWWWCRHLQSSS